MSIALFFFLTAFFTFGLEFFSGFTSSLPLVSGFSFSVSPSPFKKSSKNLSKSSSSVVVSSDFLGSSLSLFSIISGAGFSSFFRKALTSTTLFDATLLPPASEYLFLYSSPEFLPKDADLFSALLIFVKYSSFPLINALSSSFKGLDFFSYIYVTPFST